MSDHDKTKEELISELQETRERAEYLQAILDGCDDVIQVIGAEGRVVFVSRSIEKHSGFSVKEFMEMDLGQLYRPEDMARMARDVGELRNGPVGTTMVHQQWVRVKDGSLHLVEHCMTNALAPPLNGMVGVTRDLTGRADIVRDAQKADMSVRKVFNSVNDAILVHDESGRIFQLNEKVLELFRLSSSNEQQLLFNADELYGPFIDPDRLHEIWNDVLRGTVQSHEWQARRPTDGTVFHAEVYLNKIRLDDQDYVLASVRDITERKQAEEQLRAALEEKEALLREVHHRVKNNLAVVSSLLRLQSRRIKDKDLVGLFKQADFRVRCIGMVHEKLYRSESLANLRVEDYLGSLIDHLLNVYGEIGRKVHIHRDIEDLSFEPDTALPLGFITSELCSNCLKHAFPDRRSGEINVSLRSVAEGEFELTVKDNGVGIPGDVDLDNPITLGLDLVRTFADQLTGEIDIARNAGTEVRVRFRGAVPNNGR